MYHKDQIVRIRLINSCLGHRAKRYWSIRDLTSKLSEHEIHVTTRTVERDLMRMRFDDGLGYFAPIEYCRKNKGHYYSDPNYTLDKGRHENNK